MGIHGIYKEIGPGKRIALSKLSVEHYVQHSRPLRIAIDISIWLFQIQSGKGGSNPALRTFYYRLLRLLSLNIHPLFVFDGPNKPLFKRNKRVGGPNVRVSSIPEFLAKQLLKQFGFPIHVAPGEAEAECALLQREGMVDAVLSEDVDTLMFGSGLTLRSWTPELKSSKVPTHVNVYDAKVTKDGSGLDRGGMILIALMSGGDYIPEGIPGCGPKTACEAARAGFGADLCRIGKKDDVGYRLWRERLQHELRTNESKFFRQKKNLAIPDDFPNREVLGYYTHPCVSSTEKLDRLRQSLKWDQPLDYPSLRSFAADAFDWRCLGGAKKFVRNLAPALLIRELRMRAEQGANDGDDIELQEASEGRLITAIHGKRNHATTDNMQELRVSFVPMNLVDIDLSIEDPDDEMPDDSDSEAIEAEVAAADNEDCPPTPSKKRGPSTYDPTMIEKLWIMDTWLRHGIPLKVQDWEASFRDPKAYLAAKSAAKSVGKRTRAPRKKITDDSSQRGALDRFTRVTKPGISSQLPLSKPSIDDQRHARMPSSEPARTGFVRRSINPLSDVGQSTVVDEVDLSETIRGNPVKRTSKRPSPEPSSPFSLRASSSGTPKAKRLAQTSVISLLSSSPQKSPTPRARTPPLPQAIQRSSREATPTQPARAQPSYDSPLPDTVTKRRRKRSPLKRHQTAPVSSGSLLPTPSDSRPSTPTRDFHAGDESDASDLPSPSQFINSQRKASHSRAKSCELIDLDLDEADTEVQPQQAPCRGIPAWIRRSQSTTPRKARQQAASDDARNQEYRPEEVDLTESTPFAGLGSFLPAARRLKERHLSPEKHIPVSSAAAAAQPHQKAKYAPSLPTKKVIGDHAHALSGDMRAPQKQRKRNIILRQSLEGAWKEVEVESLDMTDSGGVNPSGASTSGTTGPGLVATGTVRAVNATSAGTAAGRSGRDGVGRTRWRASEVEVLDLTAD